jgi:hypothetical protein
MIATVPTDENPNDVQVTQLPAQEKPRQKAKLYPLSGGERTELRRGYAGGRERSPAVHLMKLSPHGISLMGSSGPATIKWEEVAAALAAKSPVGVTNAVVDQNPFNLHQVTTELVLIEEKLPVEAYNFMLAKYLKDEKAVNWTYYYAWCHACEMAKENKWGNRSGKEIYRNASRLAVDMELNLQSYCWCPACAGTGRNRLGECRPCKGSGKRAVKHAELAKILEVDRSNYARVWMPRVAAIGKMLEAWERIAVTHLYMQLVQD